MATSRWREAGDLHRGRQRQCCYDAGLVAEPWGADDTRQTVFPTSSAISNAPFRSTARPTGRPRVWSVRVKEAGHDILGDARGFAAAERDEYDLVALERRAIPASMLAHERAAPVVHGQINACVHGKSQWGNVGAEGIVGLDCSCHEVGPLRHDARIEMLAEVAVGPAVEATILHRCQIIRDQIGSDLVSLVGDGPQLSGLGLKLQPGRIAHAAGIDAMCTGRRVDLLDRGPLAFGLKPIFGDVAVRADPDIELGAVGARHQGLGPVVIDRAARKIRQLGSRGRSAWLSILIRIADDRISMQPQAVNLFVSSLRLRSPPKYMTKSKTGNLVLTEQEEDTLAAFMQTPTDGNTPAQK
jgi:hypothetical protein